MGGATLTFGDAVRCTVTFILRLSAEKLLDEGGKFPGMRYKPKMPTVKNIQLRTMGQQLHDLRVDRWNNRVVIAGQNQHRLP